jgi:hypothetical protein
MSTPPVPDPSATGGKPAGREGAAAIGRPPGGEDVAAGGRRPGGEDARATGGRPGVEDRSTTGGKPAGREGAAAGGTAQGGDDAAAVRRGHAVRGTLAAGLILEGITVLFVPLVIGRVGDGDGLTATRLTLLVVLALALFVAAGMQKRRAGLILGSVLQVAVIATGVLVAAMYFLGLLFAGVWAYLLWIRQEILRAGRRAPGTAPGRPNT